MEVGSETGALGLVPDLRLGNLEFRGTTNLVPTPNTPNPQSAIRNSKFLLLFS
jgi:hypothetical protein